MTATCRAGGTNCESRTQALRALSEDLFLGHIRPPDGQFDNVMPGANLGLTSVSTSYSIEGNTLIQRVNFTANTVFPVVADPFWIPALFVMAHLTRHVTTQAAARGISQALIRQVVQNGAKSAGNREHRFLPRERAPVRFALSSITRPGTSSPSRRDIRENYI